MEQNRECAKGYCAADRLPPMEHCYEHIARYEIPAYDELECPECGSDGDHGTISDSMYYCADCGELFDPRRIGNHSG